VPSTSDFEGAYTRVGASGNDRWYWQNGTGWRIGAAGGVFYITADPTTDLARNWPEGAVVHVQPAATAVVPPIARAAAATTARWRGWLGFPASSVGGSRNWTAANAADNQPSPSTAFAGANAQARRRRGYERQPDTA